MCNRRTLLDDSTLIAKLKQHYEGMESRMRALDEKTRDLYFDTEFLYNGLEDANNKILLLKNVKYVKEIILDDVVDNRSIRSHLSQTQPQISSEDRTQQMVSALKSAARDAINLVNQRVTEVEVPRIEGASSDVLPKKIYEPVNTYLAHELPPLIGTDEFMNWNYSLVGEEKNRNEFSEVVVKRTETFSPTPTYSATDQKDEFKPPQVDIPTTSSSFLPSPAFIPDKEPPSSNESREEAFFEDDGGFGEKIVEKTENIVAPKTPHSNPQRSVNAEIEALFKRKSQLARSSSESSADDDDDKPAPSIPPLKVTNRDIPAPPPIPTKLPSSGQQNPPKISPKQPEETKVTAKEIKINVEKVVNKPAVRTPQVVEDKAIKNDTGDSIKNSEVKDTIRVVDQPKVAIPKIASKERKQSVKPKSSIFSDDSDDSFDQVFNVKPRQPEAPKPTPSISTSNPTRRAANEPEEAAQKERRKITSKVRSLFDSSSSEEDLFTTSSSSLAKPKPLVSGLKQPTRLFSDSDEEQVQINNDQPELEDQDEEMPKTVLNSVPNDFSNRLNAALLRKPPQPTFIPKLKDPDQVSVKSTSSAGSQKSSQPIDHGPQKSVSALRNQLGDSLTKIHGGKLGVKTDEKKDSIPSRSPTPPKLPSPTSSQPSTPGQMNFNAVKARPRGPGGRRPAPPTQTAPTSTQKPPISTKSVPKSTPSDSAKKPVKSLFESDSDDPF